MSCSGCFSVLLFLCFFFFKQKTAYEMRISDWSSDVCSSDLSAGDDILLDAANVTLAAATDPGGNAVPTLSAGGDVVVNSAAGIAGGGVRALGNVVLTGPTDRKSVV